MGVRDSLDRMGLTLPPAQVIPEGLALTYRRLVRWGSLVYLAGHGPMWGEGWGS